MRPVRAAICSSIELPLQGVRFNNTISPRALPWAMECIGLSARICLTFGMLQNNGVTKM